MRELELNQTYLYEELEIWFNERADTDPNMTWNELNELGEFLIGESFITIHEADTTYSFVMVSYNSNGSIYKLIFKE